MEKQKKKNADTVSVEAVERVKNSVTEAGKRAVEKLGDNPVDTEKVKEVIDSLAGCSIATVAGLVSSAALLLDAGCLMVVLQELRPVVHVKMLQELMNLGKSDDKSQTES